MALFRLLLFFSAIAAGLEEPMDTWQDLLVSESFNRFVQLFADKKRLDFVICHYCGVDNNAAAFSRFFSSVSIPVATWTRRELLQKYLGRQNDNTTITSASPILIIVCDVEDIQLRNPGHGFLRHFATTAYMLPPAFNRPTFTDREMAAKRQMSLLVSFYHALNVTAIEKDVYMTNAFGVDCISCDSSEAVRKSLLRDVSLNASSLTIVCHSLYCDNGNIVTLLQTLEHKNATVRILRIDGIISPEGLARLLNGTAVTAFSSSLQYIGLVEAGFYDTYRIEVFIKRRLPLPKEVVLILPFTWEVWCTFLSCLVCSATVSVSILLWKRKRISAMKTLGGFGFMFLRQRGQMPPQLLRDNTTRIIIACWSIVILVLSTGFRGVLTSLLRNIPLEEGIERYSTDLVQKYGYTPCTLISKTESSPEESASPERTAATRRMCVKFKGRVHERSEKRIHIVPGIPSRTAEQDRHELSAAGYVKLPPVFHYHTGPEITARSPYRRAVRKTVAQGVESGLYVRARALFSFNASRWSERFRALKSSEEGQLSLSDLRPYFLVWATGMCVSTVVFFLEVAFFRVQKTTGIRKVYRVVKAVRRRLKRGETMKRGRRYPQP